MSRIIPIPTSRVGDLFVRQRLVDQVQLDQLSLFRLQTQVSTGQRLQVPSEDAPAALRAINLQRLLDRKSQVRTNLQASNQYLSAAWDRLGFVSTALSDLRGEVVGVAGNVVTESARDAVIQQIDGLLGEFLNAGNAKYQGRHLFAGSRSQDQPYAVDGDFVAYHGNQGVLRSYVDLEQLFETNLAGTDVFGGISASIEGSVHLDPHVSSQTLVGSINGGTGLGSDPAIAVSINAGGASIIDLRSAVTLGDVARLIEAGAPAGGDVTVEVTSQGLVVRSGVGTTIRVSEVAQGQSARQLGILSDLNVPATNSIVGDDLNPAVLKTTRLNDLLGTKAQARVEFAGTGNNDLLLTAARNGTQFTGTIEFVGGATAGAEGVSYNAGTNTLTVSIEKGLSTASQVAAAINAEGTFTASPDYHDASSPVQAGTGTINFAAASLTFAATGGGGESLDTASGLVLTNGGQSVTLDISNAVTVEDLLNQINGAGLGLRAEINASATGINVRSQLSGADFTIGENGGTTATQLGIRTYTEDTKLSALNRGDGVSTTSDLEQFDTSKMDSLRLVARNGVEFDVDLSTAASLQDVVNRINSNPLNNFGTTFVNAQVRSNGNGIELTDSSVPTTGDLQIRVVGGTQAAEYLKLVAPGSTQNSSHTTNGAGHYVLSGGNVLGHDMSITARDGTKLWVDLAVTTTIQDVIDRINAAAAAANNGAGVNVAASLAATGNGIQITDTSAVAGTTTIASVEGSSAAEALGFVPAGQSQVQSTTGVLQSEDRHTLEVDSVFNTLLRLRAALAQNDEAEISRSLERLDADMDRVNFARAELGGRLQNLETIDVRLEDENVQLRSALSQDLDVDLVQAISDLTARQYAFEASLRTTASLMQLSLLNFI